MERMCGFLLAVIWTSCSFVTAGTSNVIPGSITHTGHDTTQEGQYLELILDKLTSLDHRITTLDQRITSLDQRLTSQDLRLTALQIQISETCGNMPKATSDEATRSVAVNDDQTTPKPTQPPQQPSFKLRRVLKEDTDNGFEVKVEYEGTTEPEVTVRAGVTMSGGFSQPLENYGTVRHDRRIVELSLEGEHHSEMYLFFAAEDYVYGLKLRLSRGGPAREDVPFPSVALSPGRDVTYTSDGNDAEVEFIVTFDDAERLPVDDDFFWTALAKSETEENRAVRYHRYDYYPANSTAPGPVLDVKERPTQEGSYAYELLVNTTSQKTDAIFDLMGSFQFNCSDDCLVSKVLVETRLRFYQAGQKGPFPVGFVGFVEMVSEDKTVQYCNLRPELAEEAGPCEITCEVIGQDATELRLVKAEGVAGATGTHTTLTFGFWRAEVIRFDDASLLDAAGQYVCTARARGQEDSVSRTLTLELVAPAMIDKDRSNIKRHENGSLQATCFAEGYPPPIITFRDEYDYTSLDDVPLSEYSVRTFTSGNTTEAELTVPDPTLAERITSVLCKASNTGRGADRFYMNVNW